MRKILLLAVVIGLGILTSCGSKEYKPAAINEEVDKCEVCNMQVKDNPFATQLVLIDGKIYKFDDIGCLNEWKKKNGTENIAMEFVRDNSTKEWLNFNEAYYVYDKSFNTPMAYGIFSFMNKNFAQKFIENQGKGKLMTANDLNSHTWERNKTMMKQHKMGSEANHDKSEMNSADKGMHQ